jgi:phosphomannomutase
MPVNLPDSLIMSVSGVRGRVGEAWTPELMSAVAAAFGGFLRSEGADGPVYIGRDSRTSGPMLTRAAIAGLQSVGCEVVDLDMVPTPTLLLAVGDAGAAGGLGITASHNPAEWNALKLVSAEGVFLDGEQSARFREYLEATDPPRAAWDHLGGVERDSGAWSRHLERILALPYIDPEAIRAAGLRVAVDCVHGAGGPVMEALLEELGCVVHGIGMVPDGLFPRDPEPTASNLGDLGDLVRRSRAALGMAVDPDVDRLSLVDEAGTPLGEDLTLALASATVLERTPGTVVTNLSTSQVVEDVARAFGGTFVRAPVGEVNVVRRMQQEDAIVGGEGNGGVILPALHHTRDAPLAAALVLQHLVDQGRESSRVAARWPAYVIVKEKVAFPREALAEAYRALRSDLGAPEEDSSDGLRLAWPGRRSWLHVRPSGTEPLVRLIAEAGEASAARALVNRAADLLSGVV